MASTQSTSVVQDDFTTGVVGSPFVLPFVPNSMFISNDGLSIYLGSSSGLMVLTAINSLALSRTDITSPGTILALSPDGHALVLSDPVHQLIELESTSGGVETTYGGVGTHAQFSPDSQTVYIAAGNQALVFSENTGSDQLQQWDQYASDASGHAGDRRGSDGTGRGCVLRWTDDDGARLLPCEHADAGTGRQ